MALHQCQIVNETNSTILLKIIGSGLNSNYVPDIPGVQIGLMFASSPHNVDLHLLADGERVVIVWDSSGTTIKTLHKIKITSPATIKIKIGGSTSYTVAAYDANGNDLSI